MTPMWMAFRGEQSEFTAVSKVRTRYCCELTGVERKARRYLEAESDSTALAIREHSPAMCIRRISHIFCGKGGCDNTKSERIISLLAHIVYRIWVVVDVFLKRA